MATAHGSTAAVIAHQEDTQSVQIVYDTWTPRPHFIIVQRQPTQDATDNELQGTFEMIGRFLNINSQFDEKAILSFHRGKWYQQGTSEWHAHLCVPRQPYLEKARTQITEIPNNKEWNKAKTVEEGMNNWYRRKMDNYAKYKRDCVQKRIPDQTSVETILLSTFDRNSNEFKLVWTSSAPRIGVVAQSPASSNLRSLYNFMTTVWVAAERALSRQDKTFVDFGCHLCLYVRNQSGTTVTRRSSEVLNDDGSSNENPNIVGYIQMDEILYVQWLPHNIRQVWLDKFSRAEHFVHT